MTRLLDVLAGMALVAVVPLAVVTWWLAPGLLVVLALLGVFAGLAAVAIRWRLLDDPPEEPWLSDHRREWR